MNKKKEEGKVKNMCTDSHDTMYTKRLKKRHVRAVTGKVRVQKWRRRKEERERRRRNQSRQTGHSGVTRSVNGTTWSMCGRKKHIKAAGAQSDFKLGYFFHVLPG